MLGQYVKDVKQSISDIVATSSVLSFACVDGEAPYQVWLHYAGDVSRILVYSRRDRVHSKFVAANNKIAIAILPAQIPGYGVTGLTGQGTIRELTEEAEIGPAEKIYAEKFMRDDLSEQVRSGNPEDHALWEILIDSYVLFDTHNYPEEPRKEYRA